MSHLPSLAALPLALGLLVVVALPAEAAHATTKGGVEDSAAESPTESCWLEIDTMREACASTPQALAERLARDFGVVMRVGSESGPPVPAELEVPTTAVPRGIAPQASYILTYIFDGKNFTGKSKVLSASLSSAPCKVAQSYVYGQWTNLYFSGPIDPWNDRIRSLQAYNGCRVKLFAGSGYTGAPLGPIGGSKDLGILDKRASSMRIVK